MALTYGPKTDGIDHINIYSKGKTSLGRFLTNFAFAPFELPTYGRFTSVEGYWYWLSTGCRHNELRQLFGVEAKRAGKVHQVVDCADFESKVKSGIRAKLLAHPVQLGQLIDTTLPLTHYYVYGYSDDNCKVIDAGHAWITEYIDSIRVSCQKKGWKP